ncbi:hypothetical protein SAMN04244572_04133 [Azotobacter beijerinckii]|uniref:Nucleotidyltransferase domain-containing protein n=1 Tax=Azotobacter beijerinckii TaxID=170623 RepID=A0A1H6UEV2_9GAMM|nr:hypothetical protein [Azotobacter beijerinckii]SEI90849.1 hypothetical protein SAMN04244579_02408 [Azotobacter beijerinckii]SEJ47237.1 hypothetical protein SAMN04244572_04133 [Azotobacter beijerinckii]
MTHEKIDYPPLLDGGIHPFTLDDLRQLTVQGFPESTRRPALFSALTIYLELLENTGLKASVWIDGSFMCTKREPDDIDIVVVYDPSSANKISESAMPVVNSLLNTNHVKARFGLHVFDVASDDPEGMGFWFQTFGTQRDERTPKGLAELKVNL